MSFKDRLKAASEKFQKDQETAEIVRAAQRTDEREAEKRAFANETFIQPVINALPSQLNLLNYVEKKGPFKEYHVTTISSNMIHEVEAKGEYEAIKAELGEIVHKKYDGVLILKLHTIIFRGDEHEDSFIGDSYFYLTNAY